MRSILETVNSTMSDVERPLTFDDVELTTVGVRPLIRLDESTGDDSNGEGEEPASEATYTASRRHELSHHVDRGIRNLWSIGGGKWTTARATAEEMVDALFENELADRPRRDHDSRQLPAWGAFAWAEDAEPFLVDSGARLVAAGLDPRSAELVARLHGTGAERIAELVETDSTLARPIVEGGDVAAQVVVAVVDEAARTLSDIVDRRLVVGTLRPLDDTILRTVARIAAPLLGWDDGRVEREVAAESARRAALESHWRDVPVR
ncbi:MAG: glycerol-3-phosphate dehydrogenase C-terminal domain-containing protein [Ilumatobacteraceae bacterium]